MGIFNRFFNKAGVEATGENKWEIKRVIHSIGNVEYTNWSDNWIEVKKRMARDEEGLVSELKGALGEPDSLL